MKRPRIKWRNIGHSWLHNRNLWVLPRHTTASAAYYLFGRPELRNPDLPVAVVHANSIYHE
jgi:hypothetical protein